MIQYICAEKTGQLVCEGVETGVEVVDLDSGTQIQKNCTLMMIIFRQTRLIFKRKELKYQLFLLLLCKDKNGTKCIGHQVYSHLSHRTPKSVPLIHISKFFPTCYCFLLIKTALQHVGKLFITVFFYSPQWAVYFFIDLYFLTLSLFPLLQSSCLYSLFPLQSPLFDHLSLPPTLTKPRLE